MWLTTEVTPVDRRYNDPTPVRVYWEPTTGTIVFRPVDGEPGLPKSLDAVMRRLGDDWPLQWNETDGPPEQSPTEGGTRFSVRP